MPTKGTFILIEDDASYALEVEMNMFSLGYEMLMHFTSCEGNLAVITQAQPSLIVMDIEIEGSINGIECGKQLHHLGIPIVFLTSFPEERYYSQIGDIQNCAFLAKPIERFTLDSTIDLLFKNQQPHAIDQLQIKDGRQIFYRNVQDVLFIQAQDNYCKIQFKEASFLERKKMKDFEIRLQEHNNFLRVHRSYIINVLQINTLLFSDNRVVIGDNSIPISSASKVDIQRILKLGSK